MKYVELEQTLNVCRKHFARCWENHVAGTKIAEEIKIEIEALPTEEIKHGKWIKASCSEKTGDSNCSVCNHFDWSDCQRCSNCGAIMDGTEVSEHSHKNLLIFSERYKLASKFENWSAKENMSNTPFSVISFLCIEGILDQEKAREYIKKKEKRNDVV